MPEVVSEYIYPHNHDRGRTIVRIVQADISAEESVAAVQEMKRIAGRILARHYMELAEKAEESAG